MELRQIIYAILFAFSLALNAQEKKLDINVVSFELDQFSTTAQDPKYEKRDGNGERYAIVKIKDVDGLAELKGFTFDFGLLNSYIVPNAPHADELWLYVQRNAKTVTIRHPQYRTIEKYDLKTTIQAGRTYVLTLTMSRIEQTIVRGVKKQVLQFKVSPANENAVVKVKPANSNNDYELWGTVDQAGTINKLLDFGTYDYIITAVNYESSTGRVTLSNSQSTFTESVKLTPNFGFLSVDGSNGATGADIYVDDVKIGTVPYNDTQKRWTCGTHTLTINNGDLYKPYATTFEITQGETTSISPKLESDFAQTTIKVGGNAEILIDGQTKGHGSWTGPLKAGQYVIVCRQDRHRDSGMSITVRPDQADTFVVPSPTPITGSLYISSTPSGATIELDGEQKGTTPVLLQGILIGSHKVALTLTNHKSEQYDVSIKENETTNVEATLSDMAHMTVNSKPTNAELYINGTRIGTTPYSQDMASGDYEIMLKKQGYYDFKQQVHLDSSKPDIMLNLSRQYLKSSMFYLGGGVQVGTIMGVGGFIGTYIHGLNAEMSYMVGLTESEEIFWNHIEADDGSSSYTYKPTYIGGRIGYGIDINSRIRITPKIGCGIVQLKGTLKQSRQTNYTPKEAYAIPISVGCSFDYAVTPWCAVFARPEVSYAVSKSDIYNVVSEVSSKVKGYATGFNALAGLYIYF